MKNKSLLQRDVDKLAKHLDIEVQGDFARVIIRNFPLPEQWEEDYSDLLIVIPDDFPQHMPTVYVRNTCRMRYKNKPGYGYFHSYNRKDPLWAEGWAWLCFQNVWDPAQAGLIQFLVAVERAISEARADRDEVQ
jgi:hypothetical protein